MRVLFENRWQATKGRWLTWGFIAWTIGFLYWAWLLAQTYGLSPGDGGVLRPLHERLTLAGIVAVIGVLPTIGMWVFSRRYLTRIERDGDQVALTTLGVLYPGTRIFKASDFVGTAYYHGQMPGRVSANAPWTALRVAGYRIPFMVDQQAERIDAHRITALSTARKGPSRQERRRAKRQNRT